MPSDARVSATLAALAPAIAAYRAVLAETVDRVEHYLAATGPDLAHDRAAAELGQFAATRIDTQRFASFVSGGPTLDYVERAIVAAACNVLREFHRLPDTAFVLDVPQGTRLGLAVAERLAELGRPFGAALCVDLVKSGRYEAGKHDALTARFPHERWTRVERAAPPPLVVLIDGADLFAGDVAPYLDGRQRIVFVVRGGCTPAPLVRLISPSVTVVQTSKVETLAAATSAKGPAVAAVVPEGCAEFVHAPRERLTVAFVPQTPKRALGGWSVAQQQDDLAQLQALAVASEKAAQAATKIPGLDDANDPVDRLAGWLLSQGAG